MIIKQFNNKDPSIDRDIRFNFVVIKNDLSKGVSFIRNRENKLFKWGSGSKNSLYWLVGDQNVFQPFEYKDEYEN